MTTKPILFWPIPRSDIEVPLKGKVSEIRDILFPDDPAMPPGCSIKGKLAARAHFTGHRGIYHMEGCRSYGRTKRPDRWFCSENEAQAEGFRKALTFR